MDNLEKYRRLLDEGTASSMSGGGALYPYEYSESMSRYHSFKIVVDFLLKRLSTPVYRLPPRWGRKEKVSILELGSTRSFKDGQYEGCLVADLAYWDEENFKEWDWGAGSFTRIIPESLSHHRNVAEACFETVDISEQACWISAVMTKNYPFVQVLAGSSEQALSRDINYDVIYMDTGDFGPEPVIQQTGELHLKEAQFIIEKNLLKPGGLLIIDDVKNATPAKFCANEEMIKYGKSFLSIPAFLKAGFEIVHDGYQVIMKRGQ